MNKQPQATTPRLIVIAFLSFVALGLRAGLLGVAWPSMRDTFGVSLDAVGVVLIAGMIGFLLTSVNSGSIIARIGLGTFLTLGAVIAGLGYLGFALAPTWGTLIVLGMLASVGTAIIDAGLNTYFAINQSARMMNWLHACFGLGGIVSPMLMTAVINRGHSWRWGYVPVAAAYGALIVGFGLTRKQWPRVRPAPGGEGNKSQARMHVLDTLKRPVTWLSLMLFFTFTGAEGTAGQWPYTLFTEGRGIAPATAGLWVSIFWAGMTAGRVLFGFVVKYVGPKVLVRMCMIGAALAAALIWWNPSTSISFLALACMGLMLAPIFPITTSTTPQRVGAADAASTIGFQMAASRLGLSLVPGLAGVLAESFGLEIIGAFLCVNAVAMLILHEVVAKQ